MNISLEKKVEQYESLLNALYIARQVKLDYERLENYLANIETYIRLLGKSEVDIGISKREYDKKVKIAFENLTKY